MKWNLKNFVFSSGRRIQQSGQDRTTNHVPYDSIHSFNRLEQLRQMEPPREPQITEISSTGSVLISCYKLFLKLHVATSWGAQMRWSETWPIVLFSVPEQGCRKTARITRRITFHLRESILSINRLDSSWRETNGTTTKTTNKVNGTCSELTSCHKLLLNLNVKRGSNSLVQTNCVVKLNLILICATNFATITALMHNSQLDATCFIRLSRRCCQFPTMDRAGAARGDAHNSRRIPSIKSMDNGPLLEERDAQSQNRRGHFRNPGNGDECEVCGNLHVCPTRKTHLNSRNFSSNRIANTPQGSEGHPRPKGWKNEPPVGRPFHIRAQ